LGPGALLHRDLDGVGAHQFLLDQTFTTLVRASRVESTRPQRWAGLTSIGAGRGGLEWPRPDSRDFFGLRGGICPQITRRSIRRLRGLRRFFLGVALTVRGGSTRYWRAGGRMCL